MFTFEQHTFAGGQLDRDLMGRQDLAKYHTGASTLLNFTVRRQGCISKRRGTDLVCDVTELVGTADRARLVPFEFEREGGYHLLFVGGSVYVVGDGVVAVDGETARIATRASAKRVAFTGDYDAVWDVDVSGMDDDARAAHEGDLAASRRPPYIPYAYTDPFELTFCQSGDVLFVTHPDHPPAKIVRTAAGDFEYSYIDFNESVKLNPPAGISVSDSGFTTHTSKELAKNTYAERTVYYAATSVKDGIESETCSPIAFTYYAPWPNDAVVKLVVAPPASGEAPDFYKVYKKTMTDFGLIGTTENNVGDSTLIEDDYITPDIAVTPPSVTEHFESDGKFPACAAVHQQRMCYASSTDEPFRFWMSCVGDLYDFNTHSSIREDDAIEATIAATRFPRINHMVSGRDLVLFCDNGEWIVQPVSGNALTYKTVSSKIQSAIGCAREIAPVQVFDEVLFAERSRETVRAIKYQFAQDGYQSQDLSVLAADVFRSNPIVSMAYQQHPDSQLWCALEDGTLAVLTYMPEQEVVAWSRVELGGGMSAVCVATNNAIDRSTSDLKILARRDDGRWFVLRVRPDVDSPLGSTAQAAEDALCLDAATGRLRAVVARYLCDAVGGLTAFGLDGAEVDLSGDAALDHVALTAAEAARDDHGDGRYVDMSTGEIVARSAIDASAGEVRPASFAAIREALAAYPQMGVYNTATGTWASDGDRIVATVLSTATFAGALAWREAYSTAAVYADLEMTEPLDWDAVAAAAETDAETTVFVFVPGRGYVVYRTTGLMETIYRIDEEMLADVAAGHVVSAVKKADNARYAIYPKQLVRYLCCPDPAGYDRPDAVAGVQFAAEFESVRPEAQGQQSLQFERKNAKSIDLRVERGSDFRVVAHGLDEERYATRVDLPVAAADGVVTLCRRDVKAPLTGNSTGDGRVRLISTDPWPLTILSLGINYETQPLNNSEG